MPTINLTDAYIRGVTPPAEGRIDIKDAKRQGLVLRVSASGVLSWSLRYRSRTTGKVERLTIGRYPRVPLSKAREIADKRLGAIADGVNPRDVLRRERAEHEAGITFDLLCDRFLKEYVAVRRPKSLTSYTSALNPARKAWGKRKAREITRDDALALAERRGRDAPIATNRMLAILSRMFNWALDQRNPPVPSSPIIRIPKPGIERARERVLRDDELPVVWAAFGRQSPEVGRVLKTLLLNGQRLNEVIGMRRDELIDLDTPEARWLLPSERSKNGRAHVTPLAPAVVRIIKESLDDWDEGDLVFPSRRNAGEIFDKASFARSMKRLLGELDETPETRTAVRRLKDNPPTPHDLRRTLATGLGPLGVPREIVKAVLNHKEGDVTERHYDLYDKLSEKRAALNKWADHIERIVRPKATTKSNIVPIRRARRAK
jgi:integrase